MDIVDKAIRNWKLHVLALVLTVIAELIGAKSFKLGPGLLVLVPLLLFVRARRALRHTEAEDPQAQRYVRGFISRRRDFLLPYGALRHACRPEFEGRRVRPGAYSSGIRKYRDGLLRRAYSGASGLKREAVGAAFSNAREPNIAIIGEKVRPPTRPRGAASWASTSPVFGLRRDILQPAELLRRLDDALLQPAGACYGDRSGRGHDDRGAAPLVEMYPDIKGRADGSRGREQHVLRPRRRLHVRLYEPPARQLARARKMGVKDAPERPDESRSAGRRKQVMNYRQMAVFLMICGLQILVGNWSALGATSGAPPRLSSSPSPACSAACDNRRRSRGRALHPVEGASPRSPI